MKIPSMENYGVSAPDVKEAYSQAQATPEAFGAGVGSAMVGLANTMSQPMELAQKIKTEMSTLAVEDRFNNEVSGLFREIDKGYTSQMGKNAVDGYENAVNQLREAKAKILDTVSDPMEQRMMSRMLDRRFQQSKDYFDRHLDQQYKIYKDDTFTASRAMTVQNAVDFAGDAKIFDQYRRTNEHLIESYGLENGWPAERVEVEKRKDRDALVSASVQALIQQSPQQAMAFLTQHQDRISPEIAGKARKMLDPYYEAMAVSEFMAGAEAGRVNPDMMTEIKPVKAPPADIKAIIDEGARRHHVPPALAYALIRTESTFNPKAVSHKGAVGLAQLMPATALEMGIRPEDRTDPVKSVDGGMRYLSKMLTKYNNNVALALGAYNAGPGNMDKAIKKAGAGASAMEVLRNLHPNTQKETIPYVQKILKLVDGGEMQTQQPVGQPQTEEELEAWRSEMTAQAGGIYRPAIISGINARYAEMKQAMKARNDGADKLISTAVARQIEETGAVNLTQLRLNPEIAGAFEYATPSFILSLTKEQEQVKGKRAEEVSKQEKDNAEEASNRVYMSRYGAMMIDPAFARSYNPARDPELTPSQMEKLWKLREDVTTRGEKQIANDPLHTNLKQGIDIFDDVYKASAGEDLDRDYKLSRDYLFLQGVTTEAIVQAQQMSGGKVVSADDQRKIAERVFMKSVSSENKKAVDVYDALKEKFPTATATQLQQGTATALRFMENTGVDLKKALEQGMK